MEIHDIHCRTLHYGISIINIMGAEYSYFSWNIGGTEFSAHCESVPMAENSNSSVIEKVGSLNSSVLPLKIALDSSVLKFSFLLSRRKGWLKFYFEIHLKCRFFYCSHCNEPNNSLI